MVLTFETRGRKRSSRLPCSISDLPNKVLPHFGFSVSPSHFFVEAGFLSVAPNNLELVL